MLHFAGKTQGDTSRFYARIGQAIALAASTRGKPSPGWETWALDEHAARFGMNGGTEAEWKALTGSDDAAAETVVLALEGRSVESPSASDLLDLRTDIEALPAGPQRTALLAKLDAVTSSARPRVQTAEAESPEPYIGLTAEEKATLAAAGVSFDVDFTGCATEAEARQRMQAKK